MAFRKSRVKFSSLKPGEEAWARIHGTRRFAPIRKTSRGGGVFTGDPKGERPELKGKPFVTIGDPIVIRKSQGKKR